MDDKYKKRAEMIKRYNKNISDEELEKKLKQMESPEEYEKEVQSKQEEHKKEKEREKKLNKTIINILQLVMFLVGVILKIVFWDEALGAIGSLISTFILLLWSYRGMAKLEIYIFKKLGIESRLKTDDEMESERADYNSEVRKAERYERFNDPSDYSKGINFSNLTSVKITDTRHDKKTLGTIILIIFYVLYLLYGILVLSFWFFILAKF